MNLTFLLQLPNHQLWCSAYPGGLGHRKPFLGKRNRDLLFFVLKVAQNWAERQIFLFFFFKACVCKPFFVGKEIKKRKKVLTWESMLWAIKAHEELYLQRLEQVQLVTHQESIPGTAEASPAIKGAGLGLGLPLPGGLPEVELGQPGFASPLMVPWMGCR